MAGWSGRAPSSPCSHRLVQLHPPPRLPRQHLHRSRARRRAPERSAVAVETQEDMAPRDADLALERRVLHIRQAVVPVGGVAQIGPTKNGRSRAIHGIYPSVLAALREHKARQNERRLEMGPLWRDHGLVFCSEVGTPIQPRNLARDYDRWVARAGVPRIRIHDQRHTNASLLLQMGTDIKVVSERLGHAQTSITMDVYHHVTARQHQEAGDRIGAALFAPGDIAGAAVTDS